MTVRCARHVETGAHVGDHFRVVPIRTFTNVGLLTPDFRECRRQVAVPIVKAEVDAAE